MQQTSSPDASIISYMTLRKFVGLLSLTLPFIIVIGSFILDHPPRLQISLSAYYYSHMRNVLVGTLCGVSMFLFSYHGYNRTDSIISKLSGLFALGIAFFPTSLADDKSDINSKLHYISAGIFFALLSYMSIFLFTKTSGNITPEKRKRNRIYIICGIIMIVSVIGIPVDSIPAVHKLISFLKPTLIFETLALAAFGLSWLTKGEFLLKDK